MNELPENVIVRKGGRPPKRSKDLFPNDPPRVQPTLATVSGKVKQTITIAGRPKARPVVKGRRVLRPARQT